MRALLSHNRIHGADGELGQPDALPKLHPSAEMLGALISGTVPLPNSGGSAKPRAVHRQLLTVNSGALPRPVSEMGSATSHGSPVYSRTPQ
jgi:hypothetical protein